jgi:hypothetical protein
MVFEVFSPFLLQLLLSALNLLNQSMAKSECLADILAVE